MAQEKHLKEMEEAEEQMKTLKGEIKNKFEILSKQMS